MSELIDLEKARAAKKKVLAILASVAEVNGVGITRVGQGYGVKINLAESPPAEVSLPEEVDGVPVVVELVGPILKRAQ
jgi:hypothetical protein